MSGALSGTSSGAAQGARAGASSRGGTPASGRGALRGGDGGRRVEKSPQAFRTISEVAQELDVPPHVLRFWETKFSQVRPLKRGGGRRYYRPEDVDLLRRIRALLYREGYTIKGVQRVLREGGQAADPTGVRGTPGEAQPAVAADDGATPGRPVPGAGQSAPQGLQADGGPGNASAATRQAGGASIPPADPPTVPPAVPKGGPADPAPAVPLPHASLPDAPLPDAPLPAGAGSTVGDSQAIATGTGSAGSPGTVSPEALSKGAGTPFGGADGPDRAGDESLDGAVAGALAERDEAWRQRLGKVLLDLRTVREVLQRELHQAGP